MTISEEQLRERVRRHYAEAANTVTAGEGTACDCGHPGTTCAEEGHEFGPELYEALTDENLPEAAVLARRAPRAGDATRAGGNPALSRLCRARRTVWSRRRHAGSVGRRRLPAVRA